MNQFSAAIRSPHIEKLNKVVIFGLVISLFIAVYWQWDYVISQVIELHRSFHSSLVSHTKAVAKDAATYGWALIALSFAYGVFHAVGPGHGKAVIATYLGTHKESISKGIGISMATAFIQSLVAIALVSILANLLRISFADIDHFGEDMALVSYTLIIVLGLILSASALRRLFSLHRSTKLAQPLVHTHHEHHHSEHHVHQNHHYDQQIDPIQLAGSCSCKHAHVPTTGQPWLHTLAVVFSIGMRPCSGAILVLIYAHLVGVFPYGIAATLAMGLGTGLSVSAIALGSQYARQWLERIMLANTGTIPGAVNYAVISISIRLVGGAMLILLGWGLFQMALQTGPHQHFH